MIPPRTYVIALLRFILMWGAISALIRATKILSPQVFAAAYPAIPAPPTSPFAAAAIAAFLTGFVAIKKYVSYTDPKEWGHPAYLIDPTFRISAAWEPFMRNDKAGVNAGKCLIFSRAPSRLAMASVAAWARRQSEM